MAIESVEANSGSGGATFGTDTITGGAHIPYVKLMSGADAAEDLIGGDAANGLDVDVTRVGGTVAVSNAGLTELAAAINASSQMDVNIAASNATVAVSNAGITTIAGAVSGTEMQVDVVAALPAGNNNIGDVDIASIAAGDNNIGNVDIASIAAGDNNIGNVDLASAVPAGTNTIGGVSPRPETANGLSIFRSLDIDETEEEVKGSAGQIYAVTITNFATSTRYVKFYNATAGNTTVGTTTPIYTIPVPGNASDDTTLVQNFGGMGVPFDTALSVAATTGLADNDTGAPAGNDVAITVFYK